MASPALIFTFVLSIMLIASVSTLELSRLPAVANLYLGGRERRSSDETMGMSADMMASGDMLRAYPALADNMPMSSSQGDMPLSEYFYYFGDSRGGGVDMVPVFNMEYLAGNNGENAQIMEYEPVEGNVPDIMPSMLDSR